MMKTITFYSYKGGVGRSMALANVAWRMAQKGKVIGVVDLDIEAPSLSLVEEFGGKPELPGGLYGFLQAAEPREEANETEAPVRLRDYCRRIEREGFKSPGAIHFLPCEPMGDAALSDLSRSIAGYLDDEDKDLAPLKALKQGFKDMGCEYLLVDSRTGLSAISGVATILYPDQVIMVCGLNRQNIAGVETALREFGKPVQEISYLLPSLVPVGEEDRKDAAFGQLRKVLETFNLPADRLLPDLSLPYHPQLAVDDRPMLVRGVSNFLVQRYAGLTDRLIAMNPQDPITRIHRAESLLESDSPGEALALLGPLYGKPPFENDIRFLKAYGRACYESGFTIGADAPLLTALELEAQADRRAGGPGLPTIKTALLYHERLKKANRGRERRTAFLKEAKDYHGSPDDENALYTALTNTYREPPPDIEGLLEWNEEVLDRRPDFSASAAEIMARVYLQHGRPDCAHQAFERTLERVKRHWQEGKAHNTDVGGVYLRWAAICRELGDLDKEIESWEMALPLVDADLRSAVHLALAHAKAQRMQDPLAEEIRLVEERLRDSAEGNEHEFLDQLGGLYQKADRYAEAAKCFQKLLELRPWDRYELVVRIRRCQQRAGIPFDERHEAETEAWFEREPRAPFAAVSLSQLKLLRGDVDGWRRVLVTAARKEPPNAATLGAALGAYAMGRWKNERVRAGAIAGLRDSAFAESMSARHYLVLLLGVDGDWEAALAAAREALGLAPSEQWLEMANYVSDCYERLGAWAELVDFNEEFLQLHPQDVNWPPWVSRTLVRVAEQVEGDQRREHLERALDVLTDFEKRTGRLHLDVVLSIRYDILVARLADEDRARRDLERIASADRDPLEPFVPDLVPAGRRAIHLLAGRVQKGLSSWKRKAEFASDKDEWRDAMRTVAELLFGMGDSEQALAVLDQLRSPGEDEDLELSFLRLRSLEQLGRQNEAADVLTRIRTELPRLEPPTLPGREALAQIILCELRFTDGAVLAGDAAQCIDFLDIARRRPHVQAAATIYHVCCGDAEQGERLLTRLKQLGHFHEWLPQFLHDLEQIARVHRPDLDRQAIRERFPSFS